MGGLGIGLTLVRNLVERHGGTVHAASAGEGKGSTFTVTLPLAKAAAPAPAKPAEVSALTAGKMRVMVIDDNQPSAQTMGWAIEAMGHDVMIVHDGVAAIEAAKSFQPDAVLLDIGMPGMSGYDVCRAMRALPGLERATFIAQTGWGQEEHRRRSREAGFHHHLVKPVDFADLGRLLAAARKA